MDLSHSSRHLPGRLAVLVLCDGDKTPVSSPIGGGVGGLRVGGRRRRRRKDRRGMGGGPGARMDFLKR